MTGTTVDLAKARELAARVRGEIDALVGHISHRILTEIAFYSGGGVGDVEEFNRRLMRNAEAGLDNMLGAPHDPGPPAETGRLRARQLAPIDDVLKAYRIGYTELWRALVAASRTPPAISPDVVIDLGLMVFEAHNRDADALMRAFREESQHLLIQRERQRGALVDVLLAGDADPVTLLDITRSLRLPMEGAFVVVVAAGHQGEDPMPQVPSALAAIDVTSVWRQRYDASIGVLSLGDPRRGEAAMQLLRRHATGAVGVSPLVRSARRLPWALDLAELVVSRIGDRAAVEQFEDTALSMLVAGGRDMARETARGVLGQVLALPADARDVLLETLDAWVKAGGSADRAGELLHCHPNTVRKRLRRLEECTGRSLSEPGGVAEVVAASQAWQHLRSQGAS